MIMSFLQFPVLVNYLATVLGWSIVFANVWALEIPRDGGMTGISYFRISALECLRGEWSQPISKAPDLRFLYIYIYVYMCPRKQHTQLLFLSKKIRVNFCQVANCTHLPVTIEMLITTEPQKVLTKVPTTPRAAAADLFILSQN